MNSPVTSAWYKDQSQQAPARRFVDEVGIDAVPVLISEALKTSCESKTAFNAIVTILQVHDHVPVEHLRAVYERLRGNTGHSTWLNDEYKYETNDFSFIDLYVTS